MELRAAVIGLGIGKEHLKYYLSFPDVRVVGIADINEKVLQDISRNNNVNGYTDVKQMLEKEKPDCVSICTTPGSHLSLASLAAERGIHILCEKPISATIKEAEGIISVCKKNKVQLMIGFKKRFAPAYSFLKEKFAGEFGKPVWGLVKFALGRVEKNWFWDEKDGGGPIVENTVHMIDLMRFFMGEVERIHAEGGNYFMKNYSTQIDSAVFTLGFKGGAIAAVGAGYASEWGFAKEEVNLTTDRVVCEVKGFFDNPQNLKYIYRKNPSEVFEKDFDEPGGFRQEITHFLDCARNGKNPEASGEDGLKALKICLAVKESVRKGKTVILDGR